MENTGNENPGVWIAARKARLDGYNATPGSEMESVRTLEGLIYQMAYLEGAMQALVESGIVLPHVDRVLTMVRQHQGELQAAWAAENARSQPEPMNSEASEASEAKPNIYLALAELTTEAKQELVRNPHHEGGEFAELVRSVGGRLVAYYYAIGDWDVAAIVEVPDIETARTVGLAARRVGNIERASVVPLMSADQFLESLEAASEIGNRGFGSERDST